MRSARRRFTLFDAMVLIAATAIGLGLVRSFTLDSLNDEFKPIPLIPRMLLSIWAFILVVLPLPIMWSIALFCLGLRRPRPSRRQLVRQPGFVATGAVTLVAAIRLVGFLTLIARTVGNQFHTVGLYQYLAVQELFRGWVKVGTIYSTSYFAATAFGTSTAVAAAWLLLAASGRWRSEPDWLDRLGRALGTFWVAAIPFTCWWDYHMLY